MPQDKQDIRKLTIEELKAFFKAQRDKAFRAKQVYEWLWQKSATVFSEMSNLNLFYNSERTDSSLRSE